MNSLNIIEQLSYGGLMFNNIEDVEELIKNNSKVKIYFDFNWNTYKSKIMIKGIDNGFSFGFDMPQIPLVGGCFSDIVYSKMVTGQMLISNMLEIVYFNLDFFVKNITSINHEIEIVKIDRCFYAPFLVRLGKDDKGEYRYSELLLNNPDALNALKSLGEEENYWQKYHDNH